MMKDNTALSSPRLPVAQLTILSICRFAEPLALTSVFPYLPEMIESFDIPRNQVAKWVGITSAVFSAAQMCTAIPWGRASDAHGRKPVILAAMTCAMASSLLFGFSRSLRWAIVARACSGASNGNVGILRTTVAEMVPQKVLQPRAFSVLPLVWQIGSILGPILGGTLASPTTKLRTVFGNSKFLKSFPYALPNLVCAGFFTIGILIGVLFLKESLESKRQRRDYGRMIGERLLKCCSGSRRQTSLRPADDFELQTIAGSKGETIHPPKYRDVFSPQSNLNLLAYCLLALHGVTYDQLIPVFLHLPVQRHNIHLPFQFSSGFGLESGRIGLLFTVYAVVSMVLQFTMFPAVTKRFGALKCLRACTIAFPVAYFITPYTVLFPTPATQQAAMLLVMMLKAIANVFAYPCVTILLTNSANSLHILGTLNGVAVSLSAIGRAVGPYIAGWAFTWGMDNDYTITAWWLLAVFGVIGHGVTWWLKEGDGFSVSNNAGGQRTGHDVTSVAEPGLEEAWIDNDDDEDFGGERELEMESLLSDGRRHGASETATTYESKPPFADR